METSVLLFAAFTSPAVPDFAAFDPPVAVAPAPPAPVRLTTASGRVIEQRGGVWVYVNAAPALSQPVQASGCGCAPGLNCGASFCKSRGGTGCPQSCPVKGAPQQTAPPPMERFIPPRTLAPARRGMVGFTGAGNCSVG